MDYDITLPGGEIVPGTALIVVIGPNGSGKTRQTRTLTANCPIDYVNALRNTRVAPELPAVGFDTARNNFRGQKDQTRANHWELAGEFDYMLSHLLAQKSMAALEFTRRYEEDPATAGSPKQTALRRVELLWAKVFPGRELLWEDWKPLIRNNTGAAQTQYSGNTMSDGEKAALYLAGRVFSSDAGVLVVDEPETHFHSLLATRFWNALEDARPDIRFVYVTHDLSFAMSRRNARYILANPTAGLRAIDVDSSIPDDVVSALLGSASLSFYASRVVFCEGEEDSLDAALYESWFGGPDTVVKSVGGCHRVIRCVDALTSSGIAKSLTATGVIDGDFHPEAFKASLPSSVEVLRVHEVESLLCLPAVVSAVCSHVSGIFDPGEYRSELLGTVTEAQRDQIVIDRWKARLEPHLAGLVSRVSKKDKPVAALIGELPSVFDHTTWSFSPRDFLAEEQSLVASVLDTGSTEEILRIVPGKQLLPIAAKTTGMAPAAYRRLVLDALGGDAQGLEALGMAVAAALQDYLPTRYVPAVTPG